MRGIAHKAWHAGLHVIRLNQRNCGETEHLTPTLYNTGLSQDVRAVVDELVGKDGIQALWVAGYSMGGNLVLKMAGEAGETCPGLRGVAAVCPNVHPAACVAALEQRRNWIYQQNFVRKLKARLERKAKLFPGNGTCPFCNTSGPCLNSMMPIRLLIGATAMRPIIMNDRGPVTCSKTFESQPCSSWHRTTPLFLLPRSIFHASVAIPAFNSSPPRRADTVAFSNEHGRAKTHTGLKTELLSLFNGGRQTSKSRRSG